MNRHLKSIEKKIICAILNKSKYLYEIDLNNLLVCEMNDGGMGSIKFVNNREDSTFHSNIGKLDLVDCDEISVIATLSVDQYGSIYELDLWKVDFSASIDLRFKFQMECNVSNQLDDSIIP